MRMRDVFFFFCVCVCVCACVPVSCCWCSLLFFFLCIASEAESGSFFFFLGSGHKLASVNDPDVMLPSFNEKGFSFFILENKSNERAVVCPV